MFFAICLNGEVYKSSGLNNITVKSGSKYLDVIESSDGNNADIMAYHKTDNRNQVFQLLVVNAEGYCSFNPLHNKGKRLAESTHAKPGAIVHYPPTKG